MYFHQSPDFLSHNSLRPLYGTMKLACGKVGRVVPKIHPDSSDLSGVASKKSNILTLFPCFSMRNHHLHFTKPLVPRSGLLDAVVTPRVLTVHVNGPLEGKSHEIDSCNLHMKAIGSPQFLKEHDLQTVAF